MNTKVMFSSAKQDWETPDDLFKELDAEFSFALDACATRESSKCSFYFSLDADGLKAEWATEIILCLGIQRAVVWLNPPYSGMSPCKPDCQKNKCLKRQWHYSGPRIYGAARWVQKAYEESLKGATVVCLLPARTDTKWFHKYIKPYAEIRFLEGRLKFKGAKHPAPFPSMIAVFRPRISNEA